MITPVSKDNEKIRTDFIELSVMEIAMEWRDNTALTGTLQIQT